MSKQMDWTAYGGSAAETYERHMVPAIFGPWAEDLLALAMPAPGERVLDVACGTGVVARLVAQRVAPTGTVVGLDLNPGMLAVARTLPLPQGEIQWREGNVSAMPFPDASFDLALCQQGLQFFPDRPAALREVRRVLEPRGRLALSVWRPHATQPWLCGAGDSVGTPHSPGGGRADARALRTRECGRSPSADHGCRVRRCGRAPGRQGVALSDSCGVRAALRGGDPAVRYRRQSHG
jgi:SAM-dependent methyltransferase